MFVNPYETTYGKLLNITSTKRDLSRYTVTSRENLEYEYRTNDKVKTCFITGYNQEELEITPFDHPIIVDDTRDTIIYTDLRKYVKSMKDNRVEIVPEYLMDVCRDTSSMNMLIARAISTKDFYMGNIGLYRKFYKSYVQSFTTLLTYVVDNIVKLNPSERVDIIYIVAGYAYAMLFENMIRPSIKDQLVAFLYNTRFGVPPDKDYIKDRIGGAITYLTENPEFTNLIDSIKALLPESKANYITVDTIANILSGVWFGHSGGEIVLISLENAPSWFALFTSALLDNTYKKSRLTQILQNNRNINVSELEKDFGNYIRERSINV